MEKEKEVTAHKVVDLQWLKSLPYKPGQVDKVGLFIGVENTSFYNKNLFELVFFIISTMRRTTTIFLKIWTFRSITDLLWLDNVFTS